MVEVERSRRVQAFPAGLKSWLSLAVMSVIRAHLAPDQRHHQTGRHSAPLNRPPRLSRPVEPGPMQQQFDLAVIACPPPNGLRFECGASRASATVRSRPYCTFLLERCTREFLARTSG